jgi:hypothetical protein
MDVRSPASSSSPRWSERLERGLPQQLVTLLSANAVLLGIAVTLVHQLT